MSTVPEGPQVTAEGSARPPVEPAPARTGRAWHRRRWAVGALPVVVAALLGGAVAGGSVAAYMDGGASSTAGAATSAPPAPSSVFAVAGRKPESIEQIYRQASPGVVQITQGRAQGSGFVIDAKGDIVTNAHVVAGGGPVTVSFSDDDQVPARIVGVNDSTDVAVLRVSVPASALVPLPLGDSSALRVGDAVVAIGNPFGLDRSATDGIVSALDRQIPSPNGYAINGAIQTDAAINHGNSGGPLLDAHGKVVGITSQIADSGVNANVGVGFAVPINTVRQELSSLETSGSVAHAWLGVRLAPVDPAIAARDHLPVSHGAMIAGVEAGGPAAVAGLRPASGAIVVGGTSYGVGGDIVTAVGGRPVTSPQDLQSAVESLRAGDRIALTVVHPDGSTVTITVTAGVQPTTSPALAR